MQYASLAYGGMATPELKTALKQWQHQRPQYYTKQKVAITQHTLGSIKDIHQRGEFGQMWAPADKR